MNRLIFLIAPLWCFVCGAQQEDWWRIASEGIASASGSSSPTPDLLWYKFTEGSGTTVADSSGHANTGNLGTGATWVTGASGSGFGILGDSNNTALASSANVAYSTNKITITMWVKAPSFSSSTKQVIFNTESSEGNSTCEAVLLGADGFGSQNLNLVGNFAAVTGQTTPVAGNSSIRTGSWQFIATWFDNSSATAGTNWIFTNCVLANWSYQGVSATGPQNFTSHAFYLDGYGANTATCNASIDDVRIYSGLLTSNQVSQIYADPK